MDRFLSVQAVERGSASIEYMLLMAFLVVAIIGSVTSVGINSRQKLCSVGNRGDINSDGTVDYHDMTALGNAGHRFRRGEMTSAADLNCDGAIISSNMLGSKNSDMVILYGYIEDN